MKHVKRFLIVLAMLGMTGCAALQPTPIADLKMPSTLSEAGKTAQGAINEANVALTAAYNVVAANLADKTMSVTDGTKYLASLDEYAKKLDAAQDALNLGNVADANTQAQAINALILALHKQLMKGAQ